MARTRQPVKTLNKSAAAILADAEAEKARKAASRKALRDAKKAAQAVPTGEAPRVTPATPAPDDAERAARAQEEAQAALHTMRVDYDATYTDSADAPTFEAFLADQGYNPDGTPAVPTASGNKSKYTGPMLALRTAAKAYVKAGNGILCNGDQLAIECGKHSREVVIRGLIRVLNLEGNPYAHLNPGQQSMNLRNKTRTALKNGFISIVAVIEALHAASEA